MICGVWSIIHNFRVQGPRRAGSGFGILEYLVEEQAGKAERPQNQVQSLSPGPRLRVWDTGLGLRGYVSKIGFRVQGSRLRV